MNKFRMLLLVAAMAVPMFIAAPASASCQTDPDVGDICKVRDVVFDAGCRHKVGYYLGWCD